MADYPEWGDSTTRANRRLLLARRITVAVVAMEAAVLLGAFVIAGEMGRLHGRSDLDLLVFAGRVEIVVSSYVVCSAYWGSGRRGNGSRRSCRRTPPGTS